MNDARSVIHIYVTRVEDWSDAALARAERLLDSCERKRAGRFHFEMDRHLFVAAHAMLRQALAQHVAERPERLRFTNTQLGKPVLKLESAIPPQFSLSHSAGIAVCAVSDAHEVGIDVEHAERPMPPGVAERCFAITERAALAALPSAERRSTFLSLWTLKEAYSKARGLGLRLPFDQIAFRLDPNSIIFEPGPGLCDSATDWQFESLRLASVHPAGLAVRSSQRCAVVLEEIK